MHYVSLGDSSGVGIGAGGDGGYPARLARRLEAAGHRVRTTPLSKSGATSTDVVHSQLPRATAASADLITLGIGGNDAWRLTPVDVFHRQVRRACKALRTVGAPVVVANILDLSLAPVAAMAEAFIGVTRPQIVERITALNAALHDAAVDAGCVVVDLFTVSQRELAQHPAYFAADGFHPSAAGYDRWTELMWPAVAAAVGVQRG